MEHGHFQRSKADSDSSAGRNKAKGKFFREKYSGTVHTSEHPAPHKNVQLGRDDRVIPRGWYSGCSYYSSQTLALKLSEQRASKMADEDMEMDNFSEGRPESASDFAGDDENEKVVWI